MAGLQRRLLTPRPPSLPAVAAVSAAGGAATERDDYAVSYEARREDWPAPANSLVVTVSVPSLRRSVVLRYAWSDEVPYYELPLERLESGDVGAKWSCLLAVPKERREVFFSLVAAADAGEVELSDGGRRFRAAF